MFFFFCLVQVELNFQKPPFKLAFAETGFLPLVKYNYIDLVEIYIHMHPIGVKELLYLKVLKCFLSNFH